MGTLFKKFFAPSEVDLKSLLTKKNVTSTEILCSEDLLDNLRIGKNEELLNWILLPKTLKTLLTFLTSPEDLNQILVEENYQNDSPSHDMNFHLPWISSEIFLSHLMADHMKVLLEKEYFFQLLSIFNLAEPPVTLSLYFCRIILMLAQVYPREFVDLLKEHNINFVEKICSKFIIFPFVELLEKLLNPFIMANEINQYILDCNIIDVLLDNFDIVKHEIHNQHLIQLAVVKTLNSIVCLTYPDNSFPQITKNLMNKLSILIDISFTSKTALCGILQVLKLLVLRLQSPDGAAVEYQKISLNEGPQPQSQFQEDDQMYIEEILSPFRRTILDFIPRIMKVFKNPDLIPDISQNEVIGPAVEGVGELRTEILIFFTALGYVESFYANSIKMNNVIPTFYNCFVQYPNCTYFSLQFQFFIYGVFDNCVEILDHIFDEFNICEELEQRYFASDNLNLRTFILEICSIISDIRNVCFSEEFHKIMTKTISDRPSFLGGIHPQNIGEYGFTSNDLDSSGLLQIQNNTDFKATTLLDNDLSLSSDEEEEEAVSFDDLVCDPNEGEHSSEEEDDNEEEEEEEDDDDDDDDDFGGKEFGEIHVIDEVKVDEVIIEQQAENKNNFEEIEVKVEIKPETMDEKETVNNFFFDMNVDDIQPFTFTSVADPSAGLAPMSAPIVKEQTEVSILSNQVDFFDEGIVAEKKETNTNLNEEKLEEFFDFVSDDVKISNIPVETNNTFEQLDFFNDYIVENKHPNFEENSLNFFDEKVFDQEKDEREETKEEENKKEEEEEEEEEEDIIMDSNDIVEESNPKIFLDE
eukprot:TRINITY_DN3295_c3_g3_i1.p1 TRINITY_DN3295_c3_g3~~TRINITY_DN3295_c3_g3_i1.p1  ORF type:complete len:810 (-),score=314.31 TRINITY_DN3295_c3_g3_i1:1138-3567(-)